MEVAEIGVPIDTTYTHSNKTRVRVRRKALNSVLEQCQRAIQLLNDTGFIDDDDDDVCNHEEDEIDQRNESDEVYV